MSTIGFDQLYYATITDDEDGNETYGTPVSLAKAISCDLSVELAEAILYADDAAAEVIKAFKEGKGIKVDIIDMIFLSKESIKDYSFLSGVADSEGLLGYWSCEIDKLRKFCY